MTITLIVPVFNEEDNIIAFYSSVRNLSTLANYSIEILFINDGSTDNTLAIIEKLAQQDNFVSLVSFTRNFGKEAAMLAGLKHASGNAVIPIDVDQQDPIEIIPLLIEKWQNGADIVLAKRRSRLSDSFLKRKTASWFYSLHNKICQPKIEPNVGDFRLISKNIVNHILDLPECNIFMKGLLSWVGGKIEIIEYDRKERYAGKSKFNFIKLWNFAIEGITSFSVIPLKVWTYLGFIISFLSLIYATWIVIDKIFWGNPVPGYPSLLVSILFLGGIQLTSIGVLGEYIGRIYIESKRRPRYITQKVIIATKNPKIANEDSFNFSYNEKLTKH